MAESQTPETLNGEELTDLSAAKRALDYLNDDYNDGEIHEAEGGRCLVVISRTQRFAHFDTFQKAEGVRIGNVSALIDGGARLKVEIREADTTDPCPDCGSTARDERKSAVGQTDVSCANCGFLLRRRDASEGDR